MTFCVLVLIEARLLISNSRVRDKTELHTYEVARRFVSEGHHVSVLTTDVSGKLPEQEIISGINVFRTKVYFKNTDFYLSPRIYWKILRGDWDIIHCQGYHTLVPPMAMLLDLRLFV